MQIINIDTKLSLEEMAKVESEKEIAEEIKSKITNSLIQAFDKYIQDNTEMNADFDNEKNEIVFKSSIIIFDEDEFFNKIENISNQMQSHGISEENAAQICETLAQE